MNLYGILLVITGAISYGLPASLIKLANYDISHARNIIFYAFLFSSIFLQILSLLIVPKEKRLEVGRINYIKLILSGSSIALSNVCYLTSLYFIPVAVTAVLMMQSVWISTIISGFFMRKLPSVIQVFSIILILIGTMMVTGVNNISESISIKGILLGILGGFFYAMTIVSTGYLAINTPPITKAAMMILGGCIVSSIVSSHSLVFPLSTKEIKWGVLIAIFSFILPICCFVYGMPKISLIAGNIISSMELPAAVLFAWILLNECINFIQVLGIMIIIAAVILSTIPSKKNSL